MHGLRERCAINLRPSRVHQHVDIVEVLRSCICDISGENRFKLLRQNRFKVVRENADGSIFEDRAILMHDFCWSDEITGSDVN